MPVGRIPALTCKGKPIRLNNSLCCPARAVPVWRRLPIPVLSIATIQLATLKATGPSAQEYLAWACSWVLLESCCISSVARSTSTSGVISLQVEVLRRSRGDNPQRTEDLWPETLFNAVVCRQSIRHCIHSASGPRADQTWTVLSKLIEAMRVPSGDQAEAFTLAVCPQ
jgi:hypothetical protein